MEEVACREKKRGWQNLGVLVERSIHQNAFMWLPREEGSRSTFSVDIHRSGVEPFRPTPSARLDGRPSRVHQPSHQNGLQILAPSFAWDQKKAALILNV
jgi:hypothetical protein